VSVPGFITGLCWSLCALAHGQKKLAALQEGLPVASAYALEHGSSMFKHGAGISAGSLETIVLASLKAMLALPAPAKRVTETPRPRQRRDATPSNAETPRQRRDARRRDARRRGRRRATPRRRNAGRRRQRRGRRRRRRRRRCGRLRLLPSRSRCCRNRAAQSYVRAITALPHDEAIAQLRAIALALGFRLVRIKAA
jgi:hypothetical protein